MKVADRTVCILAIVSIFYPDCVLSRGGTGIKIYEPEGESVEYPSQKTGKYHSYYIAYFNPKSFEYAQTWTDGPEVKSVCKNYEPYFKNNTEAVLGEFPCPMLNDPKDFTHCCGESSYEYCCKKIDTANMRIIIGVAVAVCLGVLIALIIVACLYCSKKEEENERRERGKIKMEQMGLAHYDTVKTGSFKAVQSEDGYQITVRFKRDGDYYRRFCELLTAGYPNTSWVVHEETGQKEGKVEVDESHWVTLQLDDKVKGKPQLTVFRENAAVVWMMNQYQDICSRIPDESCCQPKGRTYPAPQGSKPSNYEANSRSEHEF